MSKEHIISAGMFPNPILCVKGLSWCPNDFKEIPVASFTKRILCERHNEFLGRKIDRAGIAAMTAFRDEVLINNARTAMKPIRWTIKEFRIDGRGLERWCVKTLINVTAEGEYRIGRDSEVIGQPSARLVRIAFGQENFRSRAGLYGLGALGNLKIKDGFRVIPYIGKDVTLLGGLFGIHGYRFLLFFEEEGVNRTMSVPDLDDGPDYETQTLYPLLAVNFKIGKYLSHRLKFDYRY